MLHATLALSLLLAAPVDASKDWLESFDSGAELARKEGKDLLVDFTGSDWCKWCRVLDVEVFRQPEFLEAARERYVLVRLDFPKGKSALAGVQDPERNREVARRYGVTSYPTVVLMTADGDAWGRTGYLEGGAEKFVPHLDALRRSGRVLLVEALALAGAFAEGEDGKRAELAERALALFQRLPETNDGAARLLPALDWLIASDPTGERGARERTLRALFATRRSRPEHVALGKSLDPKNEAGLFERAVLGELNAVVTEEDARRVCASIDALDALGAVHDPKVAWTLFGQAAMWQLRFRRDALAAKKYAARALATGEGDEPARRRLQGLAGGRE